MSTILIVEDEPKLAALEADYFRSQGYDTHCIADGLEVVAIGHTTDDGQARERTDNGDTENGHGGAPAGSESAISTPLLLISPRFSNTLPTYPSDGGIGTRISASFVVLL